MTVPDAADPSTFSPIERIDRVAAAARAELTSAETGEAVEAFRVRYLGSKGELKSLMKLLGQVDPSQRKAIGSACQRAAVRAASRLRDETGGRCHGQGCRRHRRGRDRAGTSRRDRCPAPDSPHRRRARGAVRPHGVPRRRRAGVGGRVSQLRRPQHPRTTSRPRAGGQFLPPRRL